MDEKQMASILLLLSAALLCAVPASGTAADNCTRYVIIFYGCRGGTGAGWVGRSGGDNNTIGARSARCRAVVSEQRRGAGVRVRYVFISTVLSFAGTTAQRERGAVVIYARRRRRNRPRLVFLPLFPTTTTVGRKKNKNYTTTEKPNVYNEITFRWRLATRT